ncbi:MAG: hypothetical protein C0434_02250 [Xanthomonadaceae bacterium]|nr:hypothetical protein [Xanthomonadaceae bacterium]
MLRFAARRYLRSMRALLAFALLLNLLPADAEVYRWVDENKVVHYGDKPPKEGVRPVELPPLQTYSPAAAAVPSAAASGGSDGAAAPPPPPKGGIRIVSPAPDDTIRDASAGIGMTVDVALQPGEGLLFFLDGVQQNKVATLSSAWLFEHVERGEHQLGVAIVAANGREVLRAAPVTVHVKPPIVLR